MRNHVRAAQLLTARGQRSRKIDLARLVATLCPVRKTPLKNASSAYATSFSGALERGWLQARSDDSSSFEATQKGIEVVVAHGNEPEEAATPLAIKHEGGEAEGEGIVGGDEGEEVTWDEIADSLALPLFRRLVKDADEHVSRRAGEVVAADAAAAVANTAAAAADARALEVRVVH